MTSIFVVHVTQSSVCVHKQNLFNHPVQSRHKTFGKCHAYNRPRIHHGAASALSK
jgi:hypothetical protein